MMRSEDEDFLATESDAFDKAYADTRHAMSRDLGGYERSLMLDGWCLAVQHRIIKKEKPNKDIRREMATQFAAAIISNMTSDHIRWLSREGEKKGLLVPDMIAIDAIQQADALLHHLGMPYVEHDAPPQPIPIKLSDIPGFGPGIGKEHAP